MLLCLWMVSVVGIHGWIDFRVQFGMLCDHELICVYVFGGKGSCDLSSVTDSVMKLLFLWEIFVKKNTNRSLNWKCFFKVGLRELELISHFTLSYLKLWLFIESSEQKRTPFPLFCFIRGNEMIIKSRVMHWWSFWQVHWEFDLYVVESNSCFLGVLKITLDGFN